jgi:large subunit ribosomal protein L1
LKEKAGIPKTTNPQKNKKKGEEPKKKKKARTAYKTYDMKDAETFSLLDAMRHVFCLLQSDCADEFQIYTSV